jgi:hypothetical protein
MLGNGVAIFVGVGVYLMLWLDPDIAPYPSGPGEWRSAPVWFRRLVRRVNGPVVISAVAVQGAAALLLVFGLLGWLGLLAAAYSGYAFLLVTIAWCAALVVWGLLAIRARRWRQR